MKYAVDSALCCAHGQCYLAAPDVYSADDDGFNAAIGATAEVPAGHENEARAGARACPETAITLLDDSEGS